MRPEVAIYAVFLVILAIALTLSSRAMAGSASPGEWAWFVGCAAVVVISLPVLAMRDRRGDVHLRRRVPRALAASARRRTRRDALDTDARGGLNVRTIAIAALAGVFVIGCNGCKGGTLGEHKVDGPVTTSEGNAGEDERVADEEPRDDGAEGQGDAPLPQAKVPAVTAIRPGALADEAARELGLLRASTYAHRTHVDEAAGAFDYDCSGFVVYALRKFAPGALEPLRVHASGRPLARDFVALFEAKNAAAIAPWRAIATVVALRRGDVIAWLKPAEVESKNTGHVMIVNGPPKARGEGEWVVPIVDSTAAPHGKSDDRHPHETSGLGRGTVVLLADAAGAPRGYRWSEWSGSRPHTTTIALGRLGTD